MIDEDTQDLYQEVILDHYRNPRHNNTTWRAAYKTADLNT